MQLAYQQDKNSDHDFSQDQNQDNSFKIEKKLSCSEIDRESQTTQSCLEQFLKKKKKKQYKRRRKDRIRKQKQTTLEQIKKILTQIYALSTSYNLQAQKIYELFTASISEIVFYELVNKVIKDHVDKTRAYIWSSIQTRNWQQSKKFQLFFIRILFDEFIKLKKSSEQVIKIINAFINHKKLVFNGYHKNLASNTFNYMIKQDNQIKRVFFAACQRFLIDQMDEKAYLKEKAMLNHLIQILDDSILKQFDLSDSWGWQYEEQQQKINKKKKRKNRKIGKQQKINQSTQQIIMKNLQNLQQQFNEIEDNRAVCNVRTQWLQKIDNQMSFFKDRKQKQT